MTSPRTDNHKSHSPKAATKAAPSPERERTQRFYFRQFAASPEWLRDLSFRAKSYGGEGGVLGRAADRVRKILELPGANGSDDVALGACAMADGLHAVGQMYFLADKTAAFDSLLVPEDLRQIGALVKSAETSASYLWGSLKEGSRGGELGFSEAIGDINIPMCCKGHDELPLMLRNAAAFIKERGNSVAASDLGKIAAKLKRNPAEAYAMLGRFCVDHGDELGDKGLLQELISFLEKLTFIAEATTGFLPREVL